MRRTLLTAPIIVILVTSFAAATPPVADFEWAESVEVDASDMKDDEVLAVDFTADGDVIFGGYGVEIDDSDPNCELTRGFIGVIDQTGGTPTIYTSDSTTNMFTNSGDGSVLRTYAKNVHTRDVAFWKDGASEYIIAVGDADLLWRNDEGEDWSSTVLWVTKFKLGASPGPEATQVIGDTPSNETAICNFTNINNAAVVFGSGVDILGSNGAICVTGHFQTTSTEQGHDGTEVDLEVSGFQSATSDGLTRDFIVMTMDKNLNPKDVVIGDSGSGTSGDDQGEDVVWDSNDNIVATGGFASSKLDIGGETFDQTADQDFFIAALSVDDTSSLQMTAEELSGIDSANTSGTANDSGLALTTETVAGEVFYYVTGFFSGTNVDFDGSSTTDDLDAFSGEDALLLKYKWDSSLGQQFDFQWSQHAGRDSFAESNEEGRGVAVSCDGDVFLAGFIVDEGKFPPVASGPSADPATVITVDGIGGFVASYMPDGDLNWVIKVDGDADDWVNRVMEGPIGDLAVGGSIDDPSVGDVEFDGEVTLSPDDPEGFVARVVDSLEPTSASVLFGTAGNGATSSSAYEDSDDSHGVVEPALDGGTWRSRVKVVFQAHADCAPGDWTEIRVTSESNVDSGSATLKIDVWDYDSGANGDWVSLGPISGSIGTTETTRSVKYSIPTGVDIVDDAGQSKVQIRITHEDSSDFVEVKQDWLRVEVLEHDPA